MDIQLHSSRLFHNSQLLQKHNINTIKKPLNEMVSRFNSTKDRQLWTKKLGVYKIPCSYGKVYIGKPVVTSPPKFQNTSEAPDWKTSDQW
jgi:hypothetical protein